MPRIAGGLGGTRHYRVCRQGTAPDKHLEEAKNDAMPVKDMAQTIREKARIRQARDDDRPSEDDIAREHLGPRGQKGTPDTAKMTEDSKVQTPSSLDPGHTA